MIRRRAAPRPDWPKIVESQGMYYHTSDTGPYWDESAFYEFRETEIDAIEAATYELNDMCLAAVQHVIDRDLFDRFLIPPAYRDFIRRSWDQDEHTIYARFDLAFDGDSPPKLLEYNADTPTALLEAAVIQWFWLKDCMPRARQFNSIHERLLEVFGLLGPKAGGLMHFAAVSGALEDYMTVSYLRDVAQQAGCDTQYLHVEQIGWDVRQRAFVDMRRRPIRWCFKLYPWEWMQREAFGPRLMQTECQWFEPPWKALLSNKAIQPILWELFPNSPYLLPASFAPLPDGNYVQKPILGREGANIQVFESGRLFMKTEGPYTGPAVYQELWPLPRFDDRYFPVVGSWFCNGWACGIGIREDENLITGNTSRFVPHVY